MSENIKKQMNDIMEPASKTRTSLFENDIVRRPAIVPEERPSITPRVESGDRFEKNPFFEKLQHKQVDTRKPKSNGSKGILWSLVFVLFLAGGFAVASYFATAVVEIIPTTRTATLGSDFVAMNESTGDVLVFYTATSTEESSKEIEATVEKKIQVKASGTIVIYNSYSEAPQKLVINTRLESPSRKIYRINKSVTVPGRKVVNGKVVPGSIEVVVYADAAGEDYNIDSDKPVDFTIPGFKGDPRYTKFYALSKPGFSIAGGFNDTVKVPTDEAITQAREELKQQMKDVVVEKARADIPGNMTFFPGSMIVKFEEVPQDYSEENASTVSVRAVVSVFFFDTALLTQKLVSLAFPNDKEREVTVSNMSSLAFTFLDPVDGVVLPDISKLNFHLAGEPVFIGNIDINKVRAELAGKSRKEFGTMIASQANIHKADATFRPAWNTVFPTDPSKITVKIVTK